MMCHEVSSMRYRASGESIRLDRVATDDCCSTELESVSDGDPLIKGI